MDRNDKKSSERSKPNKKKSVRLNRNPSIINPNNGGSAQEKNGDGGISRVLGEYTNSRIRNSLRRLSIKRKNNRGVDNNKDQDSGRGDENAKPGKKIDGGLQKSTGKAKSSQKKAKIISGESRSYGDLSEGEENADSDNSSCLSEVSAEYENINEKNLPTWSKDLVDASSSEAIFLALKFMCKFDFPYYSVSSSVLVTAFPNSGVDLDKKLYNPEILQSFCGSYIRPGVGGGAGGISFMPDNLKYVLKRPHIYKTTTDAYFHLRRLRQNQLFVLSGVSGSGKSKTENDILTSISYLASGGNKLVNKHTSRIESVSTVLEAFSHAATKESYSSTRCGLWREVQFNKKGKIVGQKTVTFGLDRWRTTEPPISERNFNVFYYVIYGASESVLNRLLLVSDEEKYNYLRQEKIDDPSLPNTFLPISKKVCIAMYENLVSSLEQCKFSAQVIHSIFQVLGAVLHLGNCEFVDLIGVSEAASSKNRNELMVTAKLLGVSPRYLETALTYKTTMVGDDLCTVYMNAYGASRQRDELARLLYHLVFVWLVDMLNKKLSSKKSFNQVAVLNMYGFQAFPNTILVSNRDSSVKFMSTFDQFMINMANEQLQGYIVESVLGNKLKIDITMSHDTLPLKQGPYKNRLNAVHLLVGKSKEQNSGIVGALEAHTQFKENANNDIILLNTLSNKYNGDYNFVSTSSKIRKNARLVFGINHFLSPQSYLADGFSKHNSDQLISTDFVSLFQQSSKNKFLQKLFSADFIKMYLHPNKSSSVLEAHITSNVSSRPTVQVLSQQASNKPSEEIYKRRNNYLTTELDAVDSTTPPITQVGEMSSALRNILAAADTYKTWNIFHIRPDNPTSTKPKKTSFDSEFVKKQLQAYAIPEIAAKYGPVEYTVQFLKKDFIERFSYAGNFTLQKYEQDDISPLLTSLKLESDKNYVLGKEYIFLTEDSWQQLENKVRSSRTFKSKLTKNKPPNEAGSFSDIFQVSRGETSTANTGKENAELGSFGIQTSNQNIKKAEASDETDSDYDSDMEFYTRLGDNGNNSGMDSDASSGNDERDSMDLFGAGLGENDAHNFDKEFYDDNSDWEVEKSSGTFDHVEEIPTSKTRKFWEKMSLVLTFWIPTRLLKMSGMKHPDIQMAWREKVSICLLILVLWFILLFFIVGLGLIMCPKQYVYDINEVGVHNTPDDVYVALRGVAYDITNFLSVPHGLSRGGATLDEMMLYAGKDINATFPIPLRSACPGLVTEKDDPNWLMFTKGDPEVTAEFSFIHTSGLKLGNELPDPDFYFKYVLPKLKLYRKGSIVWNYDLIKSMHIKEGEYWRVLGGKVFNLNSYFETKNAPENVDIKKWSYLSPYIESIFNDGGTRSTDITEYWARIPIPKSELDANLSCMMNQFYVGEIDTRKSFRCLFPNYLLLSFACVLMSVIVIKFLSSLQLSPRRRPQKSDKFVICQVPCYTEGEDSLKKTINGLAGLNYDDKQKLLFIICDGNIVGSGNDRSTPRIVLDILGCNSTTDPPGLSFISLGEGSKQHNIAKLYCGLYSYEGHSVPYIVVAKTGKSSEKSRPGNRGKRDSQMILLNFLNRVHFDLPMTPLDLEIYHTMKNVIGIHPTLYEFILMVDADTEVEPDSLNRLVACMVHDSRIVGICGETRISNEDFSWTTMIQVYEYFISHHMAKAFESIFGSVTCLPGCFSMYRIKSVDGKPLISSKEVVKDYSENIVDTLHKKNLLSLGEDRYLTTLVMKHFPQYKTAFTSDARCKTTVPDTWSVLLSQRRRWINSTVHNLVELMFLPKLCGFCFFSMRFIVFIDLFGTLTMPCTVIYLVYLAYLGISKTSDVGYISLVLIAAIYGLQAIIFIIKRQWQHVGWMVIYILAYPLWSLYIPIYSFWHFDDFSWGNTRIVIDEGGKRKMIVTEDEKFNLADIPMKTWSEYEDVLIEKHQQIQNMGLIMRDIEMELRPSPRENASVAERHSETRGGSRRSSPLRAGAMSSVSNGFGRFSASGMNHTPNISGIAYNKTPSPEFHMNHRPIISMSNILHSNGHMADGHLFDSSQIHHMYPHGESSRYVMGYNDSRYPSHSQMLGFPQAENHWDGYPVNLSNIPNLVAQQALGWNNAASQGMMNPMALHQHQQYPLVNDPHNNPQYLESESYINIAPGFPSDEQIKLEIIKLLNSVDLESVTKKQVRRSLEQTFQMDLTVKKQVINSAIQEILFNNAK